ncbi:UDP-N-acetylglucosamine 2-epimerase (non-hydrolyzing) [Celeribacter baekdonensis]|uniref:non-hydrolyzing UDP-N-acetylglucosamine 2-epimerase n=1 Tax=Celeribacter baekdonensis TaxID=875171 RepID=UPI0030DA6EE0|tara:strand:+ start:62367 stop:63614 length:1248 start_codon:yes stop_codon:yes gene_type:complete
MKDSVKNTMKNSEKNPVKNVAFVFGTRPEAIKVAPVIRAMQDRSDMRPIVISTGQHRDMLQSAMTEFDLKADADLDIMKPGQGLDQITARIITGLGAPLKDFGIDAVVVHGDTASTFAGALGAFYNRVPLIHLEAGLRSGHISSPFPEEANRKLVCQISDLHLAPTLVSADNLLHDGVDPDRIRVTGNTVVDAVRWAAAQPVPEHQDDPLAFLDGPDTRPIIIATVHRRESWGAPMREIAQALVDIARTHDVRIVMPLHLNPVVREAILPIVSGEDNIYPIEPLPYRQFCRLMIKAHLIVSDSSGAEEEGPSLGKPTLVLRDVTERPEAITAGAAVLIGRTRQAVRTKVSALLTDHILYDGMTRASGVYGDGQATARVLEALSDLFTGVISNAIPGIDFGAMPGKPQFAQTQPAA